MKSKILLSCAFALCLHAQTQVWLRSGAPGGTRIVAPGCTKATPTVCTVLDATGLTVNQTIVISSVAVKDGAGTCNPDPNPPYNISTINGVRVIKAVSGNTITLKNLDGSDTASSREWCEGGNNIVGWPAAAQQVGAVQQYTLASHPRVAPFDGAAGPNTRRWATGSQNGLVSLVVDSNHNATATVSYPTLSGTGLPIAVGNNLSVCGTTNSTLNSNCAGNSGSDYVVKAATEYTYTFGVDPSIPAGDYSRNDHCGPSPGNPNVIGGADNCVRISFAAVRANAAWQHCLIYAGEHMFYWDGGLYTDPSGRWQINAAYFVADPSNQSILNRLLYGINNVERVGGAGFPAFEFSADGATNALSDFASFVWCNLATSYDVARDYLTPAQKTAYNNKLYNDLSDPSPCVKTTMVRKLLGSGVTQAGGSASLTLAAADAHPDGYYANTIVVVNEGMRYGDTQDTYGTNFGLITGYVAATKIATVNWFYGAIPGAGVPYNIYATITRNGSTITGVHTSFTTDAGDGLPVSPGDFIYGEWDFTVQNYAMTGSMVQSVGSDTSLTAMSTNYTYSGSTVGIAYVVHKWNSATNSDCGLKRLQKLWPGSINAQPMQYVPRGGSAYSFENGAVGYGGNNEFTYNLGHMAHALAAAEDDPRAALDLTFTQAAAMDYGLRLSLRYQTGYNEDGSGYGISRTGPEALATAVLLTTAVIGFPDLNIAGDWAQGLNQYFMYTLRPDKPMFWGDHHALVSPYGSQGDIVWLYPYGGGFVGDVSNAGYIAPASTTSQLVNSWLDALGIWLTDRIDGLTPIATAVDKDPRIGKIPYTSQPTQYFFTNGDNVTCAAATGWPCPQNFRADAVVSRNGWGTLTDTQGNPSNSHFFYEARGFSLEHDTAEAGDLQLWAAGSLLANDSLPPGGHTDTADSTIQGMSVHLGKTNLRGGFTNPGMANISRWASANHGSWAPNYGDKDSNYAYWMADLKDAYNAPPKRLDDHHVEFKKSGTEHVFVNLVDADLSGSPDSIERHWHFPQNGETQAAQGAYVLYDEGSTTFQNATIVEQQSGVTANGDPPHTNNLICKWFSPGTITLRDDGSSYSGSNGHTHRLSVCGGTSCNATVTGYQALTVCKLATQPDTSLAATPLHPDTNWFGVQTSDKVALFGMGGTYSSMTGFTTTHAGTAQYLFAGLAPGTYNITVNGSPVTGSPFAVTAGDSSVYFESTAGTVSINGSAAPCAITTSSLAGGTVTYPYSQALNTANCTAPVTWAVAFGSMCDGLALGAANGVISGFPTTAQTCNFTVQATDGNSQTASQTYSINVTGGGPPAVAGAAAKAAGAAISAGAKRK